MTNRPVRFGIANNVTPTLRSWESCQINTERCVLFCFGTVASAGGLLLVTDDNAAVLSLRQHSA
jgi:hypothetical protein